MQIEAVFSCTRGDKSLLSNGFNQRVSLRIEVEPNVSSMLASRLHQVANKPIVML
jgi:hypothetical protein